MNKSNKQIESKFLQTNNLYRLLGYKSMHFILEHTQNIITQEFLGVQGCQIC